MGAKQRRIISSAALVFLQFLSIGLLLYSAWPLMFTWWSIVIIAGGGLIGLGGVLAIKPGRFNIRPDPKEGTQLVRHGPYLYIRHPMYAGLILACFGIVLSSSGQGVSVWWLLVILVIDVKARYEEQMLDNALDGYEAYKKKTKRFVPFIY